MSYVQNNVDALSSMTWVLAIIFEHLCIKALLLSRNGPNGWVYEFKTPNEFFTDIKKPKPVAKCDQIQCKPSPNPTPRIFLPTSLLLLV